MSILLPLYVYPQGGAWEPLYSAAKAHPDVDFTVIVNPCSGPCIASLPDKYYLDEIPKLRTFENIRPLGYVATSYASKNLSAVTAEINTYANWPLLTNNTKMKVDGIFFDETPSTYSSDKYQYLKTASQLVRNSTKFRDRFVVHNPGNITAILAQKDVLQNSYMNLSDITVVFEEAFDKWLDKNTMNALQSDTGVRRSKLAVILHSIPNISKKVLDFVVEQVEETADWLFLTDVKEKDKYYHSFSTMFADLVDSVDGS
ncbi:hypothetical protein K491DRAFT_609548 [Lophiostoma macrostomum CBS 122681]|uniref:Uncharacterized protein n=1 Tax=Lophiostoma macrostomum CBS 122681 TaxID=1314788 RepID=A0A6A6SV46_9PLEO|nr:hypothetical protein K491DRAFT_609548 [Lophiostoma macrostomum CBS 122681]